ncbi:DUF2867 domain-containing protein [Pseudomonas sp. D(2018)]|uniref:DUF2867 domain-containing protein n=1 Tax=Pseudomonas sp. D(2018) TaxID=2502238 RepID=UPI0021145A63|nr:DUF2867 domain-containing protein [Pseudomonas sp. D(2018)]
MVRDRPKRCRPLVGSSLEALCRTAYYADCYALLVPAMRYTDALQAYQEMRSRMPGWINRLMVVRDFLCRAFGMTPTKGFAIDSECLAGLEAGSQLDFFRVVSVRAEELVLRLEDRHFVVSVAVCLGGGPAGQLIQVATAVVPRTRLGKGYVRLIEPFHRQVVRSMLGRLA